MNEIKEMYNDVIMDHYLLSPNKKKLDDYTHELLGVNPSCGDEITIKVKIEDNIIKDMAFEGNGCAISISSTSILIDLVKGKTIVEALKIIENFNNMIYKENSVNVEELEEAVVFENVSNMPARIKCATLAYRTLQNILENDVNKK